MPSLIFPAGPGDLQVDVLVGLDGAATTALVVAGRPMLAPVRVRGQIDTGSNVTAIDGAIVRRLGLASFRKGRSRTVAGSVWVNLYSVSLTIKDFNAPAVPGFVVPTVTVMELPTLLPGIDVLIGLDVLMQCKLILDGPGRTFAIEF